MVKFFGYILHLEELGFSDGGEGLVQSLDTRFHFIAAGPVEDEVSNSDVGVKGLYVVLLEVDALDLCVHVCRSCFGICGDDVLDDHVHGVARKGF